MYLWYALPLLVSICFVYGATRHEEIGPILEHTVRSAIWIGSFMLAIFAVLWLVAWGL